MILCDLSKGQVALNLSAEQIKLSECFVLISVAKQQHSFYLFFFPEWFVPPETKATAEHQGLFTKASLPGIHPLPSFQAKRQTAFLGRASLGLLLLGRLQLPEDNLDLP